MLFGLRFNISALLRLADWQVAPDISKKPTVCLYQELFTSWHGVTSRRLELSSKPL
jgi:hypothetical protein